MTTITGRPAMRSAGRPPIRRDLERAFWSRIAKGLTSEDAAVACGVSQAVGSRWFRERGGMPSIQLTASSGRYLSFAEREEIALLKVAGHGVREIARRVGRAPSTISRELRRNARLGAPSSTTVPESRSGRPSCSPTPEDRQAVAHDRLREYVQERLAGQVRRSDGTLVQGPATEPWKGGTSLAVRTAGGRRRGVRSRSQTDWRSTSPTMSQCGSRTRRSTRPFTCRAVAHSKGSWSPACALGAPCGCRVHVLVNAPVAT